MGIMSILDEECLFPKATDQTFVEKLHAQHSGKNPKYGKLKLHPQMFCITHYAGTVDYDTTNWLDKNKDPINDNVASLFSKATNVLLAKLFEDSVMEEEGKESTTVSVRKGKANTFITVAQRHRVRHMAQYSPAPPPPHAHPVWVWVRHGGAAATTDVADRHAVQDAPALCAVHHPERGQEAWHHRGAAGFGAASLQRCARGHPYRPHGLPVSRALCRVPPAVGPRRPVHWSGRSQPCVRACLSLCARAVPVRPATRFWPRA
jgi:hypothetical protein